MKSLVLSSLVKVFSSSEPNAEEISGFSILKNERASFQIAFFSDTSFDAVIDAKGADGASLSFFRVEEVPVKLACFDHSDDFFISKEPGMYPDILRPLENSFPVKAGEWQSLWIEIDPSGVSGNKQLEISLLDGENAVISKKVDIEVIDALLPEQELVYTNWYHCDGICNYYGVEPFSGEFYRINRNFITEAVRHGMNCILTPLFTPALDTAVGHERLTVQLIKIKKRGGKYSFDFRELDRWIDMCRECGIRYFEFCHFFTQWGAKHAPKIVAEDRKGRVKKIFGWSTRSHSSEYDSFLRQLASALVRYVDSKGIKDNVFLHVSDEPSMTQFRNYKRRSDFLHSIFPGFRFIDALSEPEFYSRGAVDLPIPCVNNFHLFEDIVKERWSYYCCGQQREYVPNRFIAMPSLRNRVLGTILYATDTKGFLQWGYNFYNTQLSLKTINPYEVTDAGARFPAGDSFIVYPGEDGAVVPSIRLKVLSDGYQDMRALSLLESLAGKEKAHEILTEGVDGEISYKNYPHEDSWLLSLRERVNAEIKKHI